MLPLVPHVLTAAALIAPPSTVAPTQRDAELPIEPLASTDAGPGGEPPADAPAHPPHSDRAHLDRASEEHPSIESTDAGRSSPSERREANEEVRGAGVRLRGVAEIGALLVASHHLQFGRDGTYFDLRKDGRQDTMFFFGRLAAELELADHHEVIFVYQPLRLETTTALREDLRVDGVDFPAGTGVDIVYGFDFYRLSYAYDLFADPDDELAFGFGFQIRNARSSYVSTDGELAAINSNIGPVPVIKIRGRHHPRGGGFWYGGEVDGFYANIPFINGGNDPVEGLIVDASLRAGLTVAEVAKPFVNLRYLGGGAEGTDSDKEIGDGYNRNWLHTLTLTLGVEVTTAALQRPRRERARARTRRRGRRSAR
ncbi:MAG: hypothetical protein R3A79_15385 [Nannocystaceae bacterium]